VQFHPCASSEICRFGYDAKARVLALHFHRAKGIYSYLEVPEEVFEGFLKAQSKGKFFRAYILNKYETVGPSDSIPA
jgi:hypothetical protein